MLSKIIHLQSNKTHEVELNQTLGPWLGKTSKMIGCLINEVFVNNNIDLTREQWVVLLKLNQQSGLTQNQLAFITERDKTSLTRLINTMERKNLIFRQVSKKDKRVKLVYLTDQGIKSYKNALPIMQDVIKALQLNLSQNEISKTIQTLQKLQSNLTHLSTNCGDSHKLNI